MKGRSMDKKVAARKLFRLASEECGAELVEFAMSSLLLMGITVGVIGMSMAMYTYHFLSTAAQEGVRFAEVHGYTWSEYTTTNCTTSAPPNFTMVYECTASGADIQNYVQSLASAGISASSVTVDTTATDLWPGQNPDGTVTGCTTSAKSQGCLVKVKVSYTFHFIGFERLPAFSMSATSEGVILE